MMMLYFPHVHVTIKKEADRWFITITVGLSII